MPTWDKGWIAGEPSSSVTAAKAQALAALTSTETAYLDGSSAGTIVASKAVVVGSSKQQNELSVGTFGSPVAMSSNLTRIGIVSGDFASDVGASQDARMFHTRCKISKGVSKGGSIYGCFMQLRINSATGAFTITGSGQMAAAIAYVEASDNDQIVTFGAQKICALLAKVESVSKHVMTGVSLYGIQIGNAVKTTDSGAASVNFSALRIEKDAGYLDYKHAISIDDCMSSAVMLLKADGAVVSTSLSCSADVATSKVAGVLKLEIDSVTSGANVTRYIWLYSATPS